MNQKMFQQFLEKRSRTKKWLFLPLSLLCHAFLVTAILVVPFLDADTNLPDFKIIDSIKLIAKPALPPIMVGKKGSSKKDEGKMKRKKEEPKADRKSMAVRKMVAPVTVPDTIENESLDIGINGGVGEGIDGGIENGALNGIDGGLPSEFLSSPPRIGNLMPTRARPPRLLREVKPIYPAVAMRARISGIVIVEAVTDVYGKVKRARVIKGHPLLNNAALDAVKQWLYLPYIINGLPKPVIFTVTVNFDLKTK